VTCGRRIFAAARLISFRVDAEFDGFAKRVRPEPGGPAVTTQKPYDMAPWQIKQAAREKDFSWSRVGGPIKRRRCQASVLK
jgi:hypothetical protein